MGRQQQGRGPYGLLGPDLDGADVRARRYTALLDHSPLAVVIVDPEKRIKEWNPAAELLFGWSRADCLDGPVDLIVPPERLGEFETTWAALHASGVQDPVQTVQVHRDGSRLSVTLHLAAIQTGDGTFGGAVMSVSRLAAPADVGQAPVVPGPGSQEVPSSPTDLSDPVSSLELDEVTGLPGRRWLQRRLAAGLGPGQARGVALLDVDAFALLNQAYGPDVADDLLHQLADRLGALDGGGVLGRWQADEFLWIVDAPDPAVLLADLAREVAAATRVPFLSDTERVRLTVSTGLVTTAQAPLQELFGAARAALDAAKRAGRDRATWFDPGRHEQAPAGGLRLATDLQRGIAEGELRLHLQPIVGLARNDVVGVEALVRWQRPGVGLLTPASFIDVAERTGQVVALGEWVAREACRIAVALSARHTGPVRVSLNVSARQLSDQGLLSMLAGAMRDSGCPPHLLSIEITETALLYDLAAATALLDSLAELGVGLDLDDFGTGYSSLLYLKHFPVDRIKIDHSFVAGLGVSASDTAIVASVIALAHSMGMTAIAEGVETPAQLTVLRQMGCDSAQGFLLCRPEPLEQLVAWLERGVPARLAARPGGRDGTSSREELADLRDQAADVRDRLGDRRDSGGDARDRAADQRELEADRRDSDQEAGADAVHREQAGEARVAARADRDVVDAQRRDAGADRSRAEQGRTTAKRGPEDLDTPHRL